MAAQLEESFVYEVWTPKSLEKQAARGVARNLVVTAMPIIKKLLSGNIEQASRKPMEIQLKKLKEWYWKGIEKLAGDCDSKIRSAITKSLTDAIEMVHSFGQTDLLQKFAFQLLFSCEAGSFGRVYPHRIPDQVDEAFCKFLLSLSPFYIREFQDETLRFPRPYPINFIILNSSDLRRIRLYRNLNAETFDRMRMHSKKAEIITLEFNSDTDFQRFVEDDTLFKMFFSNSERNAVLQRLVTNQQILISFPSLKEVRLKCDRVLADLTSIIQCILYAYKKVKVKVTWLVSVPYDEYLAKYPIVCPTFQASGSINDQDQITCVYMFNEDFAIEEDTWVSRKPIDEPGLLHKSFKLYGSSVYYMQNVLAMRTLSNLKYVFSDDEKIRVNARIAQYTEGLRRLYIYGPFLLQVDEDDLVESLNKSPNLESLFFIVKPSANPILKGLGLLVNLKVLSLEFSPMVDYRYRYCQDTPMEAAAVGKFMELLIKAAPNLDILEVPCVASLVQITSNGYLQKLRTFCVTKGEIEVVYDCILNLPSLKCLMLDKHFKYTAYLALKRFFFNSMLQISYKRGRHVVPYIR